MKKVVLSLLFLLFHTSVFSQPYRVLFLSSYHPDFPTYRRQVEGILESFDPEEIILDEEFMDSKRFGWEENRESFLNRFNYKLDRMEAYDLVITADDKALVFFQNYSESLFPGIPHVFLGVNDRENGLSENSNPLSTGILEIVSFKETLDLIYRQFPLSEELIVISDGTLSGTADLYTLLATAGNDYPLPLAIFNLAENSFSRMEGYLSSRSKGTPVLLLSAYRDSLGETVDFNEGFLKVYQSSTGPVYHLWEHGFGSGALGGFVVDHRNQGIEAGQLARRILRGESPGNIPVTDHSPNHYLFDYEELRRWNISRNSLPKDSALINDPLVTRETLRRLVLILVGSVIVLVILIATFIRLNRKLKSAYKELLDSRNRFEYLFQNNPVVLLLLDPISGKIKDANRAALDFYGYSRDDFLSLKIFQINQLSPSEINREMQRAEHEKRNYFQFRHLLKSGEIREVEVFSGPLRLNGKSFLLSAIHDISEKARLQKELIQREKMNALGFLAGGIAHDFNNLLTGIIGYHDLLRMDDLDEVMRANALDMIYQSAAKARDLTQKILTYSRNKEKNRSILSLPDIVRDCLAEINVILPDEIVVDTDFTGEGEIFADPGEMSQIVQNLIVNGVQSMEEKGGVLTIRVVPYRVDGSQKVPKGLAKGDYILLSVEDQGTGIAETASKHLFDPYFSTKELGMGTGLGLAIVRSIVEEEEGIILVESQPGAGSEFRVILPAPSEGKD